MFTKAGTFKSKIDEVLLAEPKFAKGENDFDICIHVTMIDDPGQSDWWRGEISDNYGKGNFATQMQKEITMGTLRKLGFVGDDLSTLSEQLVGKEVPAFVKASEPGADGHVFYNLKSIVAGGGDQPKAIDAGEMKRRAALLFGGGNGAGAATTAGGTSAKPAASGATAAPKNPFAPRG